MKKIKKLFALSMIVAMLAGLLAGCGGSSTNDTTSSDERKHITYDINTGTLIPYTDTKIIQMGHVNPGTDSDMLTYFCHQLSDNLMTLTDGRYAIETMGDGSLGVERALFEGLSMGTIDAAIVSNMVMATSVDPCNIIELPFVFTSAEQGHAFITNQEMMQPIYDALWNDYGIYTNTYVYNGFRKTLSVKAPIETMDDFSGVKIRVPESTIFTKMFKNLGANPTTLAYTECYAALQQGTVEAMELPVMSTYASTLYKVAPYITATNHVFTSAAVCFSDDFWNTLSSEDQALFNQALSMAQESSSAYFMEQEQSAIDAMVADGAIYVDDIDISEMKAATASICAEYRDIVGADYYDTAMAYIDSLN